MDKEELKKVFEKVQGLDVKGKLCEVAGAGGVRSPITTGDLQYVAHIINPSNWEQFASRYLRMTWNSVKDLDVLAALNIWRRETDLEQIIRDATRDGLLEDKGDSVAEEEK